MNLEPNLVKLRQLFFDKLLEALDQFSAQAGFRPSRHIRGFDAVSLPSRIVKGGSYTVLLVTKEDVLSPKTVRDFFAIDVCSEDGAPRRSFSIIGETPVSLARKIWKARV